MAFSFLGNRTIRRKKRFIFYTEYIIFIKQMRENISYFYYFFRKKDGKECVFNMLAIGKMSYFLLYYIKNFHLVSSKLIANI
jgi:hypothetical protein